MSGYLPKSPQDFVKTVGARVAIIASMWHSDCVEGMINSAIKRLKGVGVREEDISVSRLPGAGELPFASRLLFERDKGLDGIIAFGVVLQGATTHNESVLNTVTQGFALVSDRYGKPIVNEVIGVSSIEDARARSQDNDLNKGVEAVFALSETLSWVRTIKSKSGSYD